MIAEKVYRPVGKLGFLLGYGDDPWPTSVDFIRERQEYPVYHCLAVKEYDPRDIEILVKDLFPLNGKLEIFKFDGLLDEFTTDTPYKVRMMLWGCIDA